ncbi:sn-glycerol-3-phosphate ABC transporter ATP-binding protein UgpC [Roseomonas indoligenes]|uniref:Sn-glycerol-3-phosphate ABC transporter ATP-binding protein UgpC n=1 Tax=Roseomonas indoligenes TaxID=2820811 RepID=A0A940S5U1_9PROT|nr:sn-glycerol-3-phosphate ABC transporter ATP-binding protein UgpC [Pararoseomonas indoligenes]MBP0494801.1 sn-glycerol-3-phosphate ABC transporter ATP-binding protein UgpC [Pararoseomonas indoligenes]
MATLSLRDVRKSFNATQVLHGIELEVADGELVVIVGASGCGKSTLLRIVAGLETPTSGQVVISNRDVTGLEPADRDIAMVFQNYALYPHMSVFGNMAYGLKIRGLPRAEIEKRVQAAAEILGIGALLERKPKQLSGGQRQRVAMGRAIVREPALFLFDEPLSNLDAKLRVQMRAEIRRLQRRLGVTSLFVTHDQVEAMTLGDRLVVMNAGRPAQVAPPMEIFSRPADTYVAGFIGSPSMNFIPATLEEGGRAARLAEGSAIQFADGPRPGPAGMPLILGLRPEHIEPGDGPDSLPLAVELIEPLGSETVVHGRAPGGLAVTARLPGAFSGAVLPVQLPAGHLHVFDAGSGRRLDP